MTITFNNKLPKIILIFSLVFFLVSLVAIPLAREVKAGEEKEKIIMNNPLTGNTTAIAGYVIYARLINTLLGLVGTVSLFIFVYGGFQWLISAGNPEKVKKGRDTLIWGVLGIAVALGSYTILRYVILALKGM